MEPLTISIIVVSCLFSGVGLTGTLVGWDTILAKLAGKKIAVLGARGSGKTTLYLYLNMINQKALQLEQTRSPDKARSAYIKLDLQGDNYTLRLAETYDLPGSEESRDNYWNDQFKSAEIVLYLVHAGALLRGVDKSNSYNKKKKSEDLKNEIKQRVLDDLRNIEKWRDDLKGKKKHIFIIGNHFDEIDQNFAKHDKIDSYEKEFSHNEVIKQNSQGMHKIIGSLTNEDTMKDILEQVVKIMEKKL